MKLIIKFSLAFFLTIWCFGFLIEFLFQINNNLVYAYPFLHKVYSTVCHQESYKLIEFDNLHSLVCTRCSGIYIGALVSSFVNIPTRIKLKQLNRYFFISALFVILDVLLYSLGFYAYSHKTAFISGFLLGFFVFFYFYIGLEKILSQKLKIAQEK